jgi:predicted aspartyl protease
LVVSTGSSRLMVTQAVAQRLGLDIYEVRGRKETMIGFGGDAHSGIARVQTVEVGDAIVPNLLVAVQDDATTDPLDPAVDGVLGYDFLRQFRVTIDYPAKTLVMEPL